MNDSPKYEEAEAAVRAFLERDAVEPHEKKKSRRVPPPRRGPGLAARPPLGPSAGPAVPDDDYVRALLPRGRKPSPTDLSVARWNAAGWRKSGVPADHVHGWQERGIELNGYALAAALYDEGITPELATHAVMQVAWESQAFLYTIDRKALMQALDAAGVIRTRRGGARRV